VQIPVESQAGAGGDGSADESPGQDGQKVAQEQADDNVVHAGAPLDEQGADDELGGRDMFAGVGAGKVHRTQKPVLGDGFAVKLIELIQLFGKIGGAGSFGSASGRWTHP